MKVNRLSAKAPDFEAKLDRLLQREMIVGEEVSRTVSDIIADVKTRGDAAVIDYTNRFDKFAASSMADLEISQEQLHASLKRLPDSQVKALQHAAERIRRYHDKQKQVSWHYDEPDGSVYGQKISPLEKVGVYAPGGKANYPSSILMLAIPAQVAGVKEIIATVPTQYSQDSDLVFAAAALAGVTRLFTVGGAQAIAALAFGTQTIPRVDKITEIGRAHV